MLFERCEHPNCGGWMKEITDMEGRIEEVCAKCARPPNVNIEKEIKIGRQRYYEFDSLLKQVARDRSAVWRKTKRIQMRGGNL